MINLLPPANKSDIRAARTNALLVRYIGILSVALLVLGGLIGAAYAVLDASRAPAQLALEQSQARTSQFDSVKTEADELRTNLTNAKAILDQKISYTTLLYGIASAVPTGVIINDLQLDSSTFGTEMTLNAMAVDIASGSNLEKEFAKNDILFSNVKLVSIESNDDNAEQPADGTQPPAPDGLNDGSSDPAYPVSVSISFVINKEAL